MPEPPKDPAIKLFGRTIPLPDPYVDLAVPGDAGCEVEPPNCAQDALIEAVNEGSCKEVMIMDDDDMPVVIYDGTEVDNVPKHSMDENKKIPNEDGKVVVDSKNDPEKIQADDSSQDKVLKKPDKIIPCPRCNSMDTKFCYFNNYNVNQPRHFCKNCQRYWTAGGTMRNVPVGAGRRKNKHSGSQFRHIVVGSDGLQATQPEVTDLGQHQSLPCRPSAPPRPLNANGNILKFGAERPLCESMASTLNIREPSKNGDVSSVACRENREEPSCASSVTTPNCVENGHAENAINMENIVMQSYMNGVAPLPHFQYYPGAPWAFPWGAGFLRPDNGNSNQVPWMAPPAFCPPTLPFPLMSAPFWGCLPGWPNGAPSVPWVGTNGAVSPSSSTSNSGCSGNASPTLGKHSRDSNLQGEEKIEKSLWVPKTLRIDDPDEAAKSSIWATLGIKPDEQCIFKPFQSKAESKAQTSETAPRLHANPAAFSRSQSFQEST